MPRLGRSQVLALPFMDKEKTQGNDALGFEIIRC